MNDGDAVGGTAVAGSNGTAPAGAASAEHPFIFQAADDIGILAITIGSSHMGIVRAKAGGQDDGMNLDFFRNRLASQVNGIIRTGCRTITAKGTSIGVNDISIGDCLGKRPVNRLPCLTGPGRVQISGVYRNRTAFNTAPTADTAV